MAKRKPMTPPAMTAAKTSVLWKRFSDWTSTGDLGELVVLVAGFLIGSSVTTGASILVRFFESLGTSRVVNMSTFGVKSLVESCVGFALGTMNNVFTVTGTSISSPAPDPDPELKSSSSSGKPDPAWSRYKSSVKEGDLAAATAICRGNS